MITLTPKLTREQRAIVEAGDGPVVVVAGAGTGKTRVIVERVRWLLETKPDLLPEQVLVLTYNVKAAKELQRRLDATLGPATRARLTVTNFHSFCHRVLTENPGEAGVAPNPDVLDGVSQVLLLRDIRPDLPLVYHSEWHFGFIVSFINRAKDELVTPADFDAFVAGERAAFEARFGDYEAAAVRLAAQGNLQPLRAVRGAYAYERAHQRAEARGEDAGGWDTQRLEKAADREARRTVAGDGQARYRDYFDEDERPRIDALAATYVADAAALEVMRLAELGLVYHAYQAELARRGALDFGEQIAAVTQLFKVRPNILRRWQRQFRYVLVDEFQDANVAQIELIELLGRTPDRPDNVMVVGDDDQSIYRFRGASYAAFEEFQRRFSGPPAHDPHATPPGPPRRLRLETNFRSVERVIRSANRLIAHNEIRFEPGKRLVTDREAGTPVRLILCPGPDDEAVAIVEAIKALAMVEGARPRWSDVAVLYRKHKHREAIVARLRDEDIPHTVVGGLSLFGTPEIRDLEQSLRAIADPHNDVALVRMLTAGPWRLDALEILEVSRMAKFDRRHLADVIADVVGSGVLVVDRPDEEERKAETAVDPATRAKLRRVLDTLEELTPLTWREGPFTILERYVERTGLVLDLIAADSLEAKRTVTNVASFLRFAADWQGANPNGTLAGFVDYLDAYQQSGGELPTSVELTEDVEGVRLMTLYQAKGLEFRHVIVPSLVDGEWPVPEGWAGYFPADLLRERVPEGDIHTEEERRLLYVAMTRARDTLTLTTHAGQAGDKDPSPFVGELRDGAEDDLEVVDRTPVRDYFGEMSEEAEGAAATGEAPDAVDPGAAAALVRRVMPLPTRRERRLELRLRAAELVGLMEGTKADAPEAAAARERARRRPGRRRARRRDGGRRGAGPRPRPADVPDDRARHGRRREPARRRAAAVALQLLVAQRVREVPAAVRVQLRLLDPVGEEGRRVRVRDDGPRGVRGLHPRAPRARGARGGAADARGPGAPVRRRVDADGVPGPHDRGRVQAPDRRPARQLLRGRARVPVRGARTRSSTSTWSSTRPTAVRRSASTARSTASTASRRAASRSSTTRPARSRARRASTRASSSRSTRWPAATRSASGPRSGCSCTSRSPRRTARRRAPTSSWTRPAPTSWPAWRGSAQATSPRRPATRAATATIGRCARSGLGSQ